jgi:acetyl-CoA carboxylase carboxyl transferase subunit alpha
MKGLKETLLPSKKVLTAAEIVSKAREDRFDSQDFFTQVFTDFMVLHGDHQGHEDNSIVGGLGLLGDIPVTVIATRKGTDLAEKLKTNNGSPQPAGYRKAVHLMRQADKFNRPVIMFVNTPGAYPGKSAEQMGQGGAIAEAIRTSMDLRVPVISVIYGEGGSGGALALAAANRVLMFEYATYSVLSPEGFASILWRDANRSDEAATIMGLTATDLHSQGVIDYIVPEMRPKKTLRYLKAWLTEEVQQLRTLSGDELVAHRQVRFRKF